MTTALSAVDLLIDSWLACPVAEEQVWLQSNAPEFTLVLLERIKERSTELLLTDPQTADQLTHGALLIAQALPHEPLALPLAAWARAHWELFHHEPQQAVILYQQALAGYRSTQNVQFILRLLSNLLAAICEVGDFVAAFQIYAEITQLQPQLPALERFFLISPAQNYAMLLHDVGRYQDALIAHAQARQLAEQFGALDRIGEIDVNRALTLGRLGRLDEGEQLLLASRQIAIEHQHGLTVARIEMNLGELYSAQQRPAEALRRFQAARRQFTILNNQMELGSVLLREAALLEQIGALGESSRAYAQAQAHFINLAMWQQVWLALTGGIRANRLFGRYDRAACLLAETEQSFPQISQTAELMTIHLEHIALTLAAADDAPAVARQQLQDFFPKPPDPEAHPHHAARYWLLLGETYTQRWQSSQQESDRVQAQQAYTHAQQIGESQQDHHAWRQALVGLGRLLLESDPPTAKTLLEQAWQQDDAIRQELSVQELKAGCLTRTSEILPLLLHLDAHQGEPKQMLQDVWRAKGSALNELFHITTPSDGAALAVDAEIERTRQHLAARRWEARRQSPHHLSEIELERATPEIQQLKERLLTLRWQRNHQNAAGPSAPLPTSLDLLQEMPADFLIEYTRCDQEIWAICANRQGAIHAHRLTDVDTLQDIQDELNFAFEHVLERADGSHHGGGERWLAESRKLLARFYQLLFAPLGSFALGSRLLIAPCDPLYRLPFAAFWNGRAYLVEEYELELIPTGALLALPPPSSSQGTPVIVAATAEGKLPAVQAEAAAIHAAFPESLCLIDQPATVQRLLQLPTPPRFLHIATHTVTSDIPIFTALHLAGELLAVEQCYELPLHGAALVVLSGCTTLAGMDSEGALLALQTAFMAAGAQRVLSTLWPISDTITSHWMKSFYSFLAAGEEPTTALRGTQLHFLHNHIYAHPVFWAPFVCFRR